MSADSTHRKSIIRDKNGATMFCPLCALMLLQPQFRLHTEQTAKFKEVLASIGVTRVTTDSHEDADALIRALSRVAQKAVDGSICHDPVERL